MKVELKPCPFCGGQPEIVTPEETDGQYWFIACTNDNCWGIAISDFCKTESEAIDAWNRRDGESHEQKGKLMDNKQAIKKLRSQRDEICNGCLHAVGWCESHCGFSEAIDMAIDALK